MHCEEIARSVGVLAPYYAIFATKSASGALFLSAFSRSYRQCHSALALNGVQSGDAGANDLLPALTIKILNQRG
jgi:hypothetical protein